MSPRSADGDDGVPVARGYTRQELVELTDAVGSKLTPHDWAGVVQRNPEIVKKVMTRCLGGGDLLHTRGYSE